MTAESDVEARIAALINLSDRSSAEYQNGLNEAFSLFEQKEENEVPLGIVVSFAKDLVLPFLNDAFKKDFGMETRINTLKWIATQAKSQEVRVGLEEVSVLEKLLELKDSINVAQLNVPELLQLCRCFSNLCAESEKACAKLIDTNGLSYLVEVGNFCVNDETISGSSDLLRVALVALYNILLTSSNISSFIEAGGIELIRSVMKAKRLESLEYCAMLMETVLENLPKELEDKIYNAESLHLLQETLLLVKSKIEFVEPLVTMLELFVDSRLEKQMGSSDAVVPFLKDLSSFVTWLHDKTDSKILVRFTRIVAVLFGFDYFVEHELDNDVFKTLLFWISTGKEELKVCAILSFGNICRSEASCKRLIDREIQKVLLPLLNPSEDLNVLHAVSGALKNLSITESTKKLFIKHELPERAAFLLCKTSIDIVQINLIGIIRQLACHERDVAIAINRMEFPSDNGITTVRKRLEAIANNTDIEALKCESLRLASRLVSDDTDNSELNMDESYFRTLETLISSKHALLRKEALHNILKIVLIGSKQQELVKSSQLLSKIEPLITSNDEKAVLGQIKQKIEPK